MSSMSSSCTAGSAFVARPAAGQLAWPRLPAVGRRGRRFGADAAGPHRAADPEQHQGDPGQHDAQPDDRAEHQPDGPVDDRVADLPEQPQRPGEPGGGRQQRPGDAAQAGGGTAPAPQQHAEEQPDHAQRDAERLPGRWRRCRSPRQPTARGDRPASESASDLVDDGRVRDLPDPGFAGDDGSADPEVAAALAAYDARPGRAARRDAGGAAARPAARAGRRGARRGGARRAGAGARQDLRHGDRADAGARRPHGAAGVHQHRGAAPVEARRPAGAGAVATAAEAAVQDGADAMLVDVAGPVLFVVEGDDLRELAQGPRAGRRVSGRYGWVTPGP